MTDDIYKAPEVELKKQQEFAKRPILLSILCIFGCFGSLVGLGGLFLGISAEFSTPYMVFGAISLVLSFVCFVGIWKMKKIAAYSYIGLTAVSMVVNSIMGMFAIGSIILPILICIYLYTLRDKMT